MRDSWTPEEQERWADYLRRVHAALTAVDAPDVSEVIEGLEEYADEGRRADGSGLSVDALIARLGHPVAIAVAATATPPGAAAQSQPSLHLAAGFVGSVLTLGTILLFAFLPFAPVLPLFATGGIALPYLEQRGLAESIGTPAYWAVVWSGAGIVASAWWMFGARWTRRHPTLAYGSAVLLGEGAMRRLHQLFRRGALALLLLSLLFLLLGT
ncbi:MAG: hypothetical protein Q8R92_14185 [Deltaproteobacteria bacterium]|nr:hypothetical protein [Deltaproteobacteria bacterium]